MRSVKSQGQISNSSFLTKRTSVVYAKLENTCTLWFLHMKTQKYTKICHRCEVAIPWSICKTVTVNKYLSFIYLQCTSQLENKDCFYFLHTGMIAKEEVTYWKATPFSRRVNGIDPDKLLFDKSLLT